MLNVSLFNYLKYVLHAKNPLIGRPHGEGEGGTHKAEDSTDKLRQHDSDKGGGMGVKNSGNFVDVI